MVLHHLFESIPPRIHKLMDEVEREVESYGFHILYTSSYMAIDELEVGLRMQIKLDMMLNAELTDEQVKDIGRKMLMNSQYVLHKSGRY